MKIDGRSMDRYLDQIIKARPLIATINRIVGGRMKQMIEAEMGIGTYEWTHLIGTNKVIVRLDCTLPHPIIVSVDFDRHGTDGASIFLEGPVLGKEMSWSAGCRNVFPGTPGSAHAIAIAETLGLVKIKDGVAIYNDVRAMNESAAIMMFEEIINQLRDSTRISRRITVQ